VTDTRTETLPAPPAPDPEARPRQETAAEAAARSGLATASRRHRWWTYPVAAIGVAVLITIPVLAVLPSKLVATAHNDRLDIDQSAPYARTPSSAQPVDDRITLVDLDEVASQYVPDGDIYFVTITEPSQSVLSWLVGRDDPAVRFITEETKYGFQSPELRRTFALEQMRTSEQKAQYVALQRVGYDVELVPGEVLIEAMVCLEANEDGSECLVWSPSDEVLDPGDRIVEVDGFPVEGVEDLSRLLESRRPGDVVHMRVERPGAGELEVDVELTASPDDPDRTIVGFYPFDTRRVVLPFELDIDTGSIGGPSAGLAFTLTLIDELTPGELTGGGRVAVTGTIELDGSVGRIGGLPQKASAVAQTGVDLFLVPAGQSDLAEAREVVGDDVEIVEVATVDEALEVLAAHGGDGLVAVQQSDG
jgi:Lon-like protease